MAPVSDNFVRADGALGGNWSLVYPNVTEGMFKSKTGGILISNDGYGPINAGGGDAYALWTGTLFGSDQYAQATIKTVAPPTSVINITAVSGSSSTWTYTYTLTSGAALINPQYIIVTGMQNTGNNGKFTVTTFGSGTFTVTNASGVAESGSNGTGTSPSDSGGGVVVRGSYDGRNCYFYHAGTNSFGGATFGQNYHELWKLVNGVGTELAGSRGVNVNVGDTLKLQVVGTTITAYYNGVQEFQVTDTDLSAGFPGTSSWSMGGASQYIWANWPTVVNPIGNNGTTLNNWSADSLSTPPTPPTEACTGGTVITIDHTKCGSSDSSQFPVLISGTYAQLATIAHGGEVTSSSGYDILFTSDAAGQYPLIWEIETYNSTTGAINFWVQVPVLSHTANTTIYMWYGNAAVTTFQGGNVGDVWDNNYVSVQHYGNGTSLSVADSTYIPNSYTNTNATATASGAVDGAASFDGSSDYITGTVSAAPKGDFTVDCWLNPITSVTAKGVWDFGSGNGTTDELLFDMGIGSPGDISLFINHAWLSSSTQPIALSGKWQHVAITFTGGTVTFYYNGAVQGTPATGKTNTLAQTAFVVGCQGTTHVNKYAGGIDEVRVSSVARSADWILASYNNQSSPSTFYSTNFVSAISGNAGVAGATVSYSGTASGSVTADGSGNYVIINLANGSYTITPSKTGYTFSPTSASETVNGANITGVNFTATQSGGGGRYSTVASSALDLQLINKFMNFLSQL